MKEENGGGEVVIVDNGQESTLPSEEKNAFEKFLPLANKKVSTTLLKVQRKKIMILRMIKGAKLGFDVKLSLDYRVTINQICQPVPIGGSLKIKMADGGIQSSVLIVKHDSSIGFSINRKTTVQELWSFHVRIKYTKSDRRTWGLNPRP